MATIDNIIKVNVSTVTELAEATSYGHMLLVCPPPTTPGSASTPDVAGYTNMDMLTACGFSEADHVYGAMKMIFAQKETPDVVYVAVQKKNSGVSEDITTTLQRALDNSADWWAIVPVGISKEDLQKMAEWVEECDAHKMLIAATTDVSAVPVTGTFDRTAILHETQITDYYDAGLCAVCLNYEPGSETWAYKNVAKLAGQPVTKSEIMAMDAVNIGYYLSQYNKECSVGGKTVSGEWIDIIRFRDWLVDQIQRNVFNLLTTHAKIPYTDSGIALVQACIAAAFETGKERGGIAEEYVDSDGLTVPSYTITVPRAADFSSAQRQSRKLPSIKATARLANAIHAAEINVELTY